MVIGITGSIAMGKSAVSNYLKSLGFTVIDSDAIVHNLLEEERIIQKIQDAFGEEVIVNHEVDRKALGQVIFNDSKKRELLNQIIHPEVITEIIKITNNYRYPNQDLIFVDIPLLFEENLEYLVDKTIVVYTSKEKQIERLMARDQISESFAFQKINSQMDIEEKKRKADFLIDNEVDLKNTHEQIDFILRRIKNEI